MVQLSSRPTAHRPSASGLPRLQLPLRTVAFGGLALAVATVSTLLAFAQDPRPDPFRPANLLTEWWRYPVQRNAFARADVIQGDLNGVHALPGTSRAWAVGNGGLLLWSADGGTSWAAGEVVPHVRQPAGAAPVPGARTDGASPPSHPFPVTSPVVDLARRDYHAVHFSHPDSGWAVGERGVVVATADGGRTWRVLADGLAAGTLRAVLRDPGGSGWVAGDLGLHRFDAESATWSGLLLPPGATGIRSAVLRAHGVASVVASIGGAETRIAITADGGGAWGFLLSARSRGGVWAAPARLIDSGDEIVWVVGDTGAPGRSIRTRETLLSSPDRLDMSAVVLPFPNAVAASLEVNGRVTALLRDGSLRRTTGAATWSAGRGGHRVTAYAPAERGLGRGLAVGPDGTVLATPDGGETWAVRAGGGDRIHDVTFSGGRTATAVGSGGVVLRTRNGGRSWQPRGSGTTETLRAVHFAEDGSGYAVGDGGTVLRSPDGGARRAPDPQPDAGTGARLHDVHTDMSGNVWIVGSEGTVLTRTRAGGWRRVPVREPVELRAVAVRGREVWVAGDDGRVYVTSDGGVTWTARPTGTAARLESVAFGGDGRVWVAGSVGTLLSTGDGDTAWTQHAAGVATDLTALHFGSERGWATGTGGTILETRNGGTTWNRLQLTEGADLLALAASRDGLVLAAGKGARWLRLDADGGPRAVGTAGRTWPAPWYPLTWLVVLGLVVAAVPQRRPPERADPVEGILASDRPLEPGDPDALRLEAVALGISRFLRNARTEPPLTIAITGAWGTGKSSLMNLIRGDLRHFGFRPVWFNAWHHQTEEHLLAAFLETVRRQAIPPALSLDGIRFRRRLLWIRTGRHRRSGVLALLAGALYASYLFAEPGRLAAVGDGFLSLLRVTPDAEAGFFGKLGHVLGNLVPTGPGEATALVTLLGALGFLAAVMRGARAFGVNPASLLATVGRSMRMRDIEAQTSFRHRFAVEFDDVTRALSPREMVIFVDDLDRCRAEHVLEVLEAINFLVSSGGCVVVVGMDYARVLRCVGREFETEAHDTPDAEPARAEGAEEDRENLLRRKRDSFAEQYMEKLINIEVPVPPATKEDLGRLMPSTDEEPAAERPATVRLTEWTVRTLRPVAPALSTAAAVALTFYGGLALQSTGENTIPGGAGLTQAAAPAPGSRPPADLAEAVEGSGAPLNALTPAEARRAGTVIAGSRPPRSRAVLYLGLLAAVGIGLIRLMNRPEVVVRDSLDFRYALAAWSPYVAHFKRTPRATKKFLNRVRFYAMRQTAHAPPQRLLGKLLALPYRRPRLRRFLERVGVPEPRDPAPDAHTIPETLLVALAAIQECEPERLQGGGAAVYDQFGAFVDAVGVQHECAPGLAALRYPARVSEVHRKLFGEISAGVRRS